MITISEVEAASGTERTIELEGGKQIKLKVPAGIGTGQVLRLRGQGEKRGSRTGDLYVDVVVSGNAP